MPVVFKELQMRVVMFFVGEEIQKVEQVIRTTLLKPSVVKIATVTMFSVTYLT